MMSLNRYRLRHQVKKKLKAAMRVDGLLKDTDRLLGVILIGNTLANIVASAIATLIGQRLYGDTGVALATGALTFVILIFAEMAPKGLAARKPEKIAYPASILLALLLKIFGPLVTLFSAFSSGLLKLLGVDTNSKEKENLTHEELSTVVNESGNLISGRYKTMLRSILDLGGLTVEDVMVAKSDIVGINLDDDFDDVKEHLDFSMHTRFPVFKDNINQLEGILHTKALSQLVVDDKFDIESLSPLLEKPQFIVEGTSLFEQLCHFQAKKYQIGFVVDEYGELLGLITLNDILEEIVGEFTTKMISINKDMITIQENCILVDGGMSLRELQKVLPFSLPDSEARTLNGLITEILGAIPPANSSLKIANYPFEILKIQNNRIKMVKIYSKIRQ